MTSNISYILTSKYNIALASKFWLYISVLWRFMSILRSDYLKLTIQWINMKCKSYMINLFNIKCIYSTWYITHIYTFFTNRSSKVFGSCAQQKKFGSSNPGSSIRLVMILRYHDLILYHLDLLTLESKLTHAWNLSTKFQVSSLNLKF